MCTCRLCAHFPCCVFACPNASASFFASVQCNSSVLMCAYVPACVLSPQFICLCTFSMPPCVFVCAFVCVCVVLFFLSSGPSLMRVPHVCVLYAQHYIVVRAGARVLAKQSSCLQQCGLARHRHVSCPPCLAVVSGQTDAHSA